MSIHVSEPRDVTAAEHAFGRVDAAGTVYLRLPEGEVVIGSFQAGSPTDAIAYYARKYDGLAAEVALLERRIRAGQVGPGEAQQSIDKLRASLVEPHILGDVAALRGRVDALGPAIEAARAAVQQKKAEARAASLAERESLVTEAETLAESSQWKVAGDRLKELLELWKTAPRVDRAAEQAMWKRFSAARNSFDRRRRAHFAQVGAERALAKDRKEALVKEAESLAGSTDWGPTAARYRALMTDWKASGRAGRADEEALWQRFRAAQDAFFGARSATFNEREASYADNLAAKEALAVEAEKLLPISDLAAAKASLRSLQERWEAAGKVPREAKDRLESRLRRVEQVIREAEESRWRRTNPEARARAEATVTQLRESISRLETEATTHRREGRAEKANRADADAAARRTWLAEAEKALEEFSG